MKTYEIWHKKINKFTSSGVVIHARNKVEALKLSEYKDKVKAIGGRIKDIQIQKVENEKQFSYKLA
jgi:hypothetical protein